MRFSNFLSAFALAFSSSAQTDRLPSEEIAPGHELPRILLIGDSISIGYTPHVQRLLDGKAIVHHNPGNAGPSSRGVENLDAWLATDGGSWDVIHFNHGLHDLAYRNANGRGLNKQTGRQWANLETYAANLETIVARLKETDAELIFATTTPVPEGEPGRVVGDAVKYNTVATAIMESHGIAVNDLHRTIAPRMEEFARRPGDVHFTNEGSLVLARQVVRSIERALAQRDAGQERRWKSAKKPTFEPTRKLTFATFADVEVQLHVFEPDHHAPTDRRPAIVFFFGGGWTRGTPRQFHPHCDYLAGRGMVAIAAEYRVHSKHGTTPFECVVDGKSALRFVRQHAKDLGIDPDKIAAAGGSAGGHVAAATATLEGFEPRDAQVPSTPNALVLFNPVYDNGPKGYGHARVQSRWRDISPLHNIKEGMPPTITFLGTADSLVPVATAETFRDTMRALGSRSELVLYEGRPHGFFNHGRGDGEDYKDAVRRMDEFLASLGFLRGRPTLR